MVHKHRSARKATLAKDVSPMRSMDYKYTLSSSPADGSCFGLGARLAAPVAVMPVPSTINKWKFNNMVTNDRDQFNNLHLY